MVEAMARMVVGKHSRKVDGTMVGGTKDKDKGIISKERVQVPTA